MTVSWVPAKTNIFAGPGILFLVSCGFAAGPAPDTIPVKSRTGGAASTISMGVVPVQLYEYQTGPKGYRDFKITSSPPLRFAFPAAYYSAQNNVDGGPQMMIALRINSSNFKPTRISRPRGMKAADKNNSALWLAHMRASMSVTIYSNLTGPEAERIADPLHAEKRLQAAARRAADGLRLAGTINGYDFHAFQNKNDAMSGNRLEPMVVNGMDLNASSYVAVPHSLPKSNVKSVECMLFAAKCSGVFTYRGRSVEFNILKQDLQNLDITVIKLIALMDKYSKASS